MPGGFDKGATVKNLWEEKYEAIVNHLLSEKDKATSQVRRDVIEEQLGKLWTKYCNERIKELKAK
jgi:hypothetical protein